MGYLNKCLVTLDEPPIKKNTVRSILEEKWNDLKIVFWKKYSVIAQQVKKKSVK